MSMSTWTDVSSDDPERSEIDSLSAMGHTVSCSYSMTPWQAACTVGSSAAGGLSRSDARADRLFPH